MKEGRPMKFYEILQKDPAALKHMIKQSNDPKEIKRLKLGMLARALLIVVFAIAFVAPCTLLFNSQNSAMAVSIFCILLAVRFVDFGYCIQDSLINLGIVFFLLLISPVLASYTTPVLRFLIHFLSLALILTMTCHQPEMGNGGLYSFAYIFLCGNPVSGEVLIQRFLLTCFGFILCAAIFFHKHKDKHTTVRFHTTLKAFSLYEHKYQWQLRLALGLSLLLTLFSVMQVERFMWAGFACGSLLSDTAKDYKIHKKLSQRLIGVLCGCCLFVLLYSILPTSFYSLIGPFGGLCLGLCSDYRSKTALNCLGALMLATGIYGLNGSVVLRIEDTLIGIFSALAFYYLYDFIIVRRFQSES